MGKTASVIGALAWMLAAVLGLLLLFALPLARLVMLAHGLGLAPLAVLYVVEGVVLLVRGLCPWRGPTWFKDKDAATPDITLHAMGLELAVTTAATVLLVVTGPLWQPVVHVDVPPWIVGFIALRAAGSSALYSLCVLRRPVAMVLALFDLTAVLPLVALAYGSLDGAVVISAFITWVFVLATAWMPGMGKLPSEEKKEKEKPTASEEADRNDRWKLGSWLSSIEGNARRPLLAAIGGLAIMIPSIAAILLQAMLMSIFYAAARTQPSKELGSRIARGIIVAPSAIMFVSALGPAIFRFVFPASFGDGAAMQTLAWTGVVFLPMAIYTDPVRASQLRVALGSLIALGLLFALAIGHGVDGVYWAIASSALIGATIGTTNRDAKEPIVSI